MDVAAVSCDAIRGGYVRIIKRGRGDQYGTRATDLEELSLGDVIHRFTEHKLQSRPPRECILPVSSDELVLKGLGIPRPLAIPLAHVLTFATIFPGVNLNASTETLSR